MNTDEPTVRQVKAEFLKALNFAPRNFTNGFEANGNAGNTIGIGGGGGGGHGGSGLNRTFSSLAPIGVAMTTGGSFAPTPAPASPAPPVPVLLYSLGFGLAGLTVIAQLALALLAITRACRKRRQHADCLYGLCAHAAIIGAVQGGYVTVAHTLLLARGPDGLDDPLWRVNCKAYLFCRSLLPGLFLHLLAVIGVAFKTVRYPARRCNGGFCGRAGSLAVHCLPWAMCGGALLPALVLHKDVTESAIRAGRCAVPELWPWLAPLLVLFGLPQVALLLLTCLLCAFQPYAASAEDEDEDADSADDANNGEGELRPPGYSAPNHLHPADPQRAQPPSRTLLRGRPMRIARLLLIVLNCMEAATQLPYSVISLLQTVLRNRQARHLIPDDTVDIAFWLHLAFFPVASVFLAALVVQLDKAYQLTERELHQRGGKVGGGGRGGNGRGGGVGGPDEVLYTASMLSSV